MGYVGSKSGSGKMSGPGGGGGGGGCGPKALSCRFSTISTPTKITTDELSRPPNSSNTHELQRGMARRVLTRWPVNRYYFTCRTFAVLEFRAASRQVLSAAILTRSQTRGHGVSQLDEAAMTP